MPLRPGVRTGSIGCVPVRPGGTKKFRAEVLGAF